MFRNIKLQTKLQTINYSPAAKEISARASGLIGFVKNLIVMVGGEGSKIGNTGQTGKKGETVQL